MPSGYRTDKQYKASDEDRIAMCEIVARMYRGKFPNLMVSRYEIDKGETIDTYFTIKDLREKYPDKDFYFFLGSDILPSMFDWPYSEQLVNITKFLIAYRQGYPIEEKDLKRLKEYRLMDKLLEERGERTAMSHLSSTIAREQIQDGKQCDSLGTLHPQVMKLIADRRLYNYSPNTTPA